MQAATPLRGWTYIPRLRRYISAAAASVRAMNIKGLSKRKKIIIETLAGALALVLLTNDHIILASPVIFVAVLARSGDEKEELIEFGKNCQLLCGFLVIMAVILNVALIYMQNNAQDKVSFYDEYSWLTFIPLGVALIAAQIWRFSNAKL